MPESSGPSRRPSIKILITIAVVVVVMIGGTSVQMARTSTTEYCISCHEMSPRLEEMKASSHAKAADGTEIGCADCHVPNAIGPKFMFVKTFIGMKDLVVHYFGDPENLSRRAMQAPARRFIDDANCLRCHQDLTKDAKGEGPVSEVGRLCHEAYQGTNGNTSRNCAGCHFNLAHLPEFDRRYDFNREFAERLPLKQGGSI